ncbi:PPOX class F420-dependent oxidoreductase [Catelliglobosispora koreensis]|uniref:PPOX class F420-dependent oxidoreductase n=1 Tax=Catelliglobosispora koreensis TaxID=129052 RepID=UPI00035FF1AE|nr:PPOX class F420-dependent oxidoreductase [Catelliglobosispora koreensis]
MTLLEEIAKSPYALVTTFRKNGNPVPTPVWIVPFEDGLGVWTVPHFGKVKRIRKNPAVTVATCDLRGNNAGPSMSGTASLLDFAGTQQVRAAIRRKYGLVGRLTLLGSRIRRGKDGVIGIKIVAAAE